MRKHVLKMKSERMLGLSKLLRAVKEGSSPGFYWPYRRKSSIYKIANDVEVKVNVSSTDEHCRLGPDRDDEWFVLVTKQRE